MKKSKFTESQILETLQEAESGVPVAEVCRKRGISVATFYRWKRKYAGMTVSELKRVKELEAENARLKRMYAGLALENAAIKDVLSRKWWSRLPGSALCRFWRMNTTSPDAEPAESRGYRGLLCTSPGRKRRPSRTPRLSRPSMAWSAAIAVGDSGSAFTGCVPRATAGTTSAFITCTAT